MQKEVTLVLTLNIDFEGQSGSFVFHRIALFVSGLDGEGCGLSVSVLLVLNSVSCEQKR